ncbi:hypothetical protein [Actinomadura sp. DC4]|uniref:hypothetical protein n=1 Tax=Actinomadura sp. DC4 TaxID=3055069 RepID=UPI0025B254A7|nr:hypothetical protein [Actinomadura sp. DC4]MDN3354200.1 hypothetical protein [Actinomadura sp. DC4]
MSDRIPPLRELCFTRNGHRVPPGFAVSYVRAHGSEWLVAEEHWERLVAQVLRTKDVGRRASPGEAMRAAVTIASTLLSDPLLRRRCPYCPSQVRGGAHGREPAGAEQP